MTSLASTDTANRIRGLLVKEFKLDPEHVTADARFVELGIDSIGMAELIFIIEDEFRLKLHDVGVQLATFGEVVKFIDDEVVAQRGEAPAAPVAGGVQEPT